MKSLLLRLRRLFSQRRRKNKWILVVVNPAAGQLGPDLRLLNRIIHAAGWDWEVQVTNSMGDGGRAAQRAVSAGASLVAACGGDGTIMDVAAGLLGSEVPMAILPSGTGNVLAKDLGIPLDLAGACSLIFSPRAVLKPIDIGVVGERLFLLRLGAGLEADIVRAADRGFKDRLGMVAYVAATIQAWSQAPLSHYHLELDGQIEEIDGLACMVANAGAIGIPGLTLSPQVQIDDGLLDVFIIRRGDLAELGALAAILVSTSTAPVSGLPHWQVREVSIQADPPQGVEMDGEALGSTPVYASVLPSALRVIVPGKT
jgi:diacylglycerol kinase (ATP)